MALLPHLIISIVVFCLLFIFLSFFLLFGELIVDGRSFIIFVNIYIQLSSTKGLLTFYTDTYRSDYFFLDIYATFGYLFRLLEILLAFDAHLPLLMSYKQYNTVKIKTTCRKSNSEIERKYMEV